MLLPRALTSRAKSRRQRSLFRYVFDVVEQRSTMALFTARADGWIDQPAHLACAQSWSGSSQWISLNLNPSVRQSSIYSKSLHRKKRVRDALGGSLASLGRSWHTSANLGQSRQISANLGQPGQPRPTSANLGQPRPISASLGHPRPPLAHAPTTHAPISYQWSMAGPSSALPPSPPATPQSSPVSSVTGPFDRTEPARHSRRPSLRPYATRAEGSEIDRGARRTRLLPHTNTTIPI